jgi:hypothetical protein
MERWLKLGFVVLCLASTTFPSLRTRYCIPGNHYYVRMADSSKVDKLAGLPADTTYGDTTLYAVSDELTWMLIGKTAETVAVGDTMYERHVHGTYKKNVWVIDGYFDLGVWEGFDETDGFAGTDDPVGDISQVPDGVFLGDKSPVDSAVWVDSIAERGSFPFLGANVDASLEPNAVILVLHGQLTVPEDGEYTFISSGRYEGLKLWIDVDGDGEFSMEKDTVGLEIDTTIDEVLEDTTYDTSVVYEGAETNFWSDISSSDLSLDLMFGELGGGRLRAWTVNLSAGTYKIRASYWHWGTQKSTVALGWKKPGATGAEVIPADAFGDRKQYGVPYITIPAILKGGLETGPFSDTIECVAGAPVDTIGMAWVAKIENTDSYAGATYTYTWIVIAANGTRDTVVHTSTATLDTLAHEMAIAGGGGSEAHLSVSLELDGQTLQLRDEVGEEVEVICRIETGVRAPALSGREALRLTGSRLVVNTARNAPVNVRFYSADGRRVLSRDLVGLQVLDLAKVGLPAGMYIARISHKSALRKSVQVLVR